MESFLTDARRYLDRAQSGLDTLHSGPLDHNIFTTCDCLRTAAACLEEYERAFEIAKADAEEAEDRRANPLEPAFRRLGQ